MTAFDRLHPPARDDPTAAAYKDWYHLNIFDHGTGRVGLINVSLHGAPADPRARAIATALIHDPHAGWAGNVEVAGLSEAAVGEARIALGTAAVGVEAGGERLTATADVDAEGFAASIEARPAAHPRRVATEPPFGSGWIGWSVLPRLSLAGRYRLHGAQRDLAQVSGYHDHNWGRWHWGDDIGWEWGAFVSEAPGPVFVVSRTTDRAHRRVQPPQLLAVLGVLSRRFAAESVSIAVAGSLEARLRRLPGALAALHQDRMRPRLPARLRIEAVAGMDWLVLEFTAHAAAQLIAGDPVRPGYAFIHEIVGAFVSTGRVRGLDAAARGLGVFEYVQ
ncbi:MAG: hypothetical protein IRY94_03355 [Rhodospirillaceae bacterium]|nr:hypothetical protein [Rhodospirillaceae bacterium]